MSRAIVPSEGELAAPTSEGDEEVVLFEGHPALLPSAGALLVCILTLGLATFFFWVKRSATHYRITTQRVVIERGLLSKRMDQIDLYRINDYVVEMPFAQRLLGTGNLVLTSMDKSNPLLRLEALKTDVRALYEKLRKATETAKRRANVRMVDYE